MFIGHPVTLQWRPLLVRSRKDTPNSDPFELPTRSAWRSGTTWVTTVAAPLPCLSLPAPVRARSTPGPRRQPDPPPGRSAAPAAAHLLAPRRHGGAQVGGDHHAGDPMMLRVKGNERASLASAHPSFQSSSPHSISEARKHQTGARTPSLLQRFQELWHGPLEFKMSTLGKIHIACYTV